MAKYRSEMEKGDLREAYSGLMEYIMKLRAYLENKYPHYAVSGSVYQGYMDMTYFSFFPESLKREKLKVAIVFVHDKFAFEVWLAGYNKQVQKRYWNLFRESGWGKYRIPSKTEGADSIIEHTLAENPDFGDLDALTRQIENGTLEFIKDIEGFLSKNK